MTPIRRTAAPLPVAYALGFWIAVAAAACRLVLPVVVGTDPAGQLLDHSLESWIAPIGLLLIAAASLAYRRGRLGWAAAAGASQAALAGAALLLSVMGHGAEALHVRAPISPYMRWLVSERMTPTLAIVFLYAACPLAALPWIPRALLRAVAVVAAGTVMLACGALFGAGEVAALAGPSGFNPLQGMGLTAALGFLGAGGALVATGLGRRRVEAHAPLAGQRDSAAPVVGSVLAALLSATLFTFQWADGERAQSLRARFEVATKDIVDDVGDRMPTYALALRGGATFLERTGHISRADWRAYVSSLNLTATFPGFLGIGYLAYVPPGGMPNHLRAMAALWPDGYRMYPATSRGDHAPVVLLEPGSERNRKVIGFDHLSETTRRAAIAAARDSGEPVVSGTIVLVLDEGRSQQFGFQLYAPVYRRGQPAGTAEQRRRAFAGIVFSPFRFDQLMRGVLLDRYPGVRVRLLDGNPDEGARLVFDTQQPADGSLWRRVPLDTIPVGANVLGHRWTLLATPEAGFSAKESRSRAWLLLGAGTLISLLIAAGIWQLDAMEARERSLAEAQALNAEIDSRLRAEQALQAEREQARLRVEALNRELVQRAAELEAANRDLEAFSYSVSHDLKQPVSGIAGYSSILLEDFANGFAPEAKEFVERIQAASFRMSQLIEGLLSLSSIARGEVNAEAVDLSRLAQETLDELRVAHLDRRVETAIAPGLVARGDRKLLQVLVSNLIGNAWKYSSKNPQARIEMGRTETARGPAFYVRDNGTGFDMAKAGQLFTAFHRLHSGKDFPGTGIGLATVHRIVTRHGGRIWAESSPGSGATFYFTLPPQDQGDSPPPAPTSAPAATDKGNPPRS